MAKIDLQARGCDVDDALQAHVEDKLEHLERLWPKSDEAMVRFSLERGRYAAEITLWSGGMVTRGEERAGNARQAFDLAIDKLERQLRRYKNKVTTQARRHDNRDLEAGTISNMTLPDAGIATDGISTIPATNGDVPEPISADGENGGDEHEEVVRVKRFALKPMSAEEAAMQMDLLGHEFFVFRDATSNQVSVVYRRRGGGYGLIEPVAD